MPGFSLSPVAPYPPEGNADFPLGIQWQDDGTNLGDRGGVDTVNLRRGMSGSRGTGESSNVLTIDADAFRWIDIADEHRVEASDLGNGLKVTVASGGVVIVPDDDELELTPGQGDASMLVMQAGEGAVSIFGVTGVQVNVRAELLPVLAGQFSVVSLIHTDTNEWVICGDLAGA